MEAIDEKQSQFTGQPWSWSIPARAFVQGKRRRVKELALGLVTLAHIVESLTRSNRDFHS